MASQCALQRKRRVTATLVEDTAEITRSEQLIQWLQVMKFCCLHVHMQYRCVSSTALTQMHAIYRTMGLHDREWR